MVVVVVVDVVVMVVTLKVVLIVTLVWMWMFMMMTLRRGWEETNHGNLRVFSSIARYLGAIDMINTNTSS